jgi:alkylation response protein AidB-like acyl-CoA dehydrogenase
LSDRDTDQPTVEEFRAGARRWLEQVAVPRGDYRTWGEGPDELQVFPEWDTETERQQFAAAREWLLARSEAGFSGIAFPASVGGRGLSRVHDLVYQMEEGRFVTPSPEIWSVGFGMVMPTIIAEGSDRQRERFVPAGISGRYLFCQLFSEPDAGSDLAAMRTRADRDGSEWVINGAKVWTSMARAADFGLLLCRDDPSARGHGGFTMFLVDMAAKGVDVRPIRQITGGATFNEVILDEVVVPDSQRLGPVGEGWRVAMTTLLNERSALALGGPVGSFERLVALARHLDRTRDPVVRQALADVFARRRILDLNAERSLARLASGAPPGPESSISKLAATELLARMGALAAAMLGPRLTAQTGEWGTFAWNSHLFGSVGLRIGGGTDEIQRNMLAERVLGLPREGRS